MARATPPPQRLPSPSSFSSSVVHRPPFPHPADQLPRLVCPNCHAYSTGSWQTVARDGSSSRNSKRGEERRRLEKPVKKGKEKKKIRKKEKKEPNRFKRVEEKKKKEVVFKEFDRVENVDEAWPF